MAFSLKGILDTIKRNTLDKTDIDERIGGFATNAYNSVKSAFSPRQIISPLSSNAPNRPATWNTPQTYQPQVQPQIYQPQGVGSNIPAFQPPLPSKPAVKSEAAVKLQSRLDALKKYGTSFFQPMKDKTITPVKSFINKNTIFADPTSNKGDNFWGESGRGSKLTQKTPQQAVIESTPIGMFDAGTRSSQALSPRIEDIINRRDEMNSYIDEQPKAKWLGQNVVKPFANTALTTLDQLNQNTRNFSDAYRDIFYNLDGNKNVVPNVAKMIKGSAGNFAVGTGKSLIPNFLNAVSDTNFSKALTSGYANIVTGANQINNDGGNGIDAEIGRFIGGIAGWRKNPINDAGAMIMNKFIPYKNIVDPKTGAIIKKAWQPIKNKITNFLVTRGSRGMVEDLIDNISQIDENKSDAKNTVDFVKNELIGALSEIVSEKVMDVGGKVVKRTVFGTPMKDGGTEGGLVNSKTGQFFGNQYVKVANSYNKKISDILESVNGKLPEKDFVPNPLNPNNSIRADALDPKTGLPRGTDNSQYNQMWGMAGGMETYTDENGETKVRFNPKKAALGMAVTGGVKNIGKSEGGEKLIKNIFDKVPDGIKNFRLPGSKPEKTTKSISDILANKKFDTKSGYTVKGQNINVDKMIKEGWDATQVDYAIKLANQAKVNPDNAEAYVRGVLKSQYPNQASKMGGLSSLLEPSPNEIVKGDFSAKKTLDEIFESKVEPQKLDEQLLPKVEQSSVEPKSNIKVVEQMLPKTNVTKTEVPKTKPIATQIDDFSVIHPKKKTVIGKSAETAYENLETGGQDLVDQISAGLKKTKVSESDFIKFVENPDIAPAELKPAVNAHRKLMESLHGLRENKGLGKLENYFPHMTDDGLVKNSEIQKLGNSLWVSDYTKELGTSKKRTGALTDFSTDYNKVMKNYLSQTAYDKYGKRIGMDQKTADFVSKVDDHLKADDDGLYDKPTSDFNYIDESATKNDIKKKISIFADTKVIDTFDSLRRKISGEKNGKVLSDSMVRVRDVGNKVTGINQKLEKLDTAGQIELLSKELVNVGEKSDVRKLLNNATNGGEKEITQTQIRALLKAEKDFTIQKFIDETGKYQFNKDTQKYINKEIDRMIKSSRYDTTFWNKTANLISGTFYRAQIWGNVSTGIAQKMESTRIPVLYDKDVIGTGAKRGIADLKSGDDVLERYDFADIETNVSKQLNTPKTKSALSQIDEKVGKVGNFFVNVGENSKNRDFLLTAEAQGEKMGLKGQRLKDFVRNELFANGFILHEFSTPKMLENPAVRLALQYQQYNIKLINRMMELGSQGQNAKAVGLLGTQALSAAILLGITGKVGLGITDKEKRSSAQQWYQGIKNRVIPGFGPIVSIASQLYELTKQQKDTSVDKSAQITKLGARNTIPFANQFFKTFDAKKVLDKGYDLSGKGNVKYVAGKPNLIEKGQALIFGKTSLPNARKYSDAWLAKNAGKTNLFPGMTANQSAVLKSKPKEEQEAYYNKKTEGNLPNKEYIENRTGTKKTTLLSSIFNKKADAVDTKDMTSADIAKQNSRTKAMLDEGMVSDLTDDELNTYFFNTVNNLPEDTESEKYKKTSDLFKKVGSISASETLDDDTKEKLLGMSGISKQEIEYYNQAKDDATTKALRQEEKLSTMSRKDWFNSLSEGRKLVGNKQIVDNATLNELYERGVLSDAERDYLKAIKFDPVTDDYYFDRDYKGSGGGLSATKKKAIIKHIGVLNDAIYSSSKKLRSSLDSKTSKTTSISDFLKAKPVSKKISDLAPSKSLTKRLRKRVTPIS